MNNFGRLNRMGMEANATKDKVRYLREKYNLGYDMQPKENKMKTGRYVYAMRNDGREFIGMIHDIRSYNRGTLVTVCDANEDGLRYRNVYREECKIWEMADHAYDLDAMVSG